MNNTINNINSRKDLIHVLNTNMSLIRGYKNLFFSAIGQKNKFVIGSTMYKFWDAVCEKWLDRQRNIVKKSEGLHNAYEERENNQTIQRLRSRIPESVRGKDNGLQET